MDQKLNNKMTFQKNNYQIINNFIEDDFIDFIQDYYSLKVNCGNYQINKDKFTYGYYFENDFLMETILQNCCESLSKIIGINLLPTYSCVNFHMNGDKYENDKEESSEISAILFLGTSGEESDLINFGEDRTYFSNITLSKGDLFIYKNLEYKCWREEINNKWLLESVLNFVDSEGEYKDFIYDKRSYLGFPKNIKNLNGD
jgi:hypothetical protein